MQTNASWARSELSIAAVAAALTVGVCAQAPPDLDAVLTRIGRRIEQYYKRAQNIICVEKVLAQPVGHDLAPTGFGRMLEYDLWVESDSTSDGDAPTDAKVVRDLKKVNGRAPKPADERGCYDPNPLSPEPLAFLLPSHRTEYAFTWRGFGTGRDRHTLIIDFRPLETGRPELLEDPEGRPECFSISLPGATKGRIWVDEATDDVLRVEEHLSSPINLRVPYAQQQKHGMPSSLVIERYDWSVRYKAVAFENPTEQLLLPEVIDMLAMMRGAQSHRKHQTFSNYQRFMTGARVVKDH